MVGVVAAMRMRDRGIQYRVIERNSDFGGTWHTHSNNYSTTQACRLSDHYELHLYLHITCTRLVLSCLYMGCYGRGHV